MRALMRCTPLALALSLFTTTAAAAADPATVAGQLLDHLQAGQMQQAEAMFTAPMAQAVPAAKLAALWSTLGTLQQRGPAEVSPQQGVQLVVVPLQFSTGRLVAQVAVDGQDKVAGLLLRPAAADPAPAPPADAAYSEADFSVPQARGALPGTLAVPPGKGPFPAVVLVHGSGPQDRNETIGGNRPFLDMARALAAQGIAVLRYDKRSFARPQDFSGNFTVDDETTDDAVAALAALAADPRIDGRRVFVMGHSQGGMLAPRIASRWPPARGAILWAAPARPLLDLLPEQNRYLLLASDGTVTPAVQRQLDALDAQIAAARASSAVPASELPLGLPQAYWKSTDAVDARAEAKALHAPLLLLHGGRDFQVTDSDWALWQQAMAGHADATLKRYPALNHLGIAGSGRGTPAEYGQPGHVDAQLMADVAHWVEAQR